MGFGQNSMSQLRNKKLRLRSDAEVCLQVDNVQIHI